MSDMDDLNLSVADISIADAPVIDPLVEDEELEEEELEEEELEDDLFENLIEEEELEPKAEPDELPQISLDIKDLKRIELPPFKMTEREEIQMKPYSIEEQVPEKGPSETVRIFVMREYITFLVKSKNPTYQIDSFANRRLNYLMYGVEY